MSNFVPDSRFVAAKAQGLAVMVKDLAEGSRAFMQNGGALKVLRHDVYGFYVLVCIESTGIELKFFEEAFVIPERDWPA